MKIDRCINSLKSAGYKPEKEEGKTKGEWFVVWLVGTVEHKRRFINGVMV